MRSVVSIVVMGFLALPPAFAAREAVLKQIQLPHNYYFREMLLPQLTSGPSSVTFSPDGQSLVYSMAGSLWRQAIGADVAQELTRGPGYDYQPDWSPDGRHIVFTRHHANAIQIVRLDVATGKELQLTSGSDVNLQPRYSPDGKRLAYVSTKDTGHFNLFVAEIADQGLSASKFALPPRESAISRYYYSTHDHTINPSWTPDGERLVFVSNREIAYGSGSVCVAEPDSTTAPTCFNNEETSWRAQPEVGPDGDRVLYSSYQGRQWHQLWLTTLSGDATLPLTFGEFDVTQARWSPDGRRIAYVSNEDGNLSLWVQEVVGGKRTKIRAVRREHRSPVALLKVRLTDASGKNVPGRLSVVGSDARAYAPVNAWIHADDGFDPQQQREETRYFHCLDVCEVEVPLGDVAVTAWRGQQYTPAHRTIKVGSSGANELTLRLEELRLPAWAPRSITADMHVHMNYGGHYRSELQTLARQAQAENLDVVYNTIVNKEQRVPDVSLFSTKPFVDGRTIVYQSQEYHTSFWGHMALLHLDDHYLTPGFSAYQHSALTSPYPHNGVIADLAHAQNAIVGYVHPYDWSIVPEKEKALTHTFPADAALGKADYVEVVGFADHKSTAEVWYRLLNLGFRVPTGSGTDAMTNYASLRGPVGMNRAYLHTEGATTPAALKAAVKSGRTVASNGPQLALQIDQRNIGDVISLPAGKHRLRYRASMRSIAPIDHLEIVQNGRVVASHHFDKDRTRADMVGEIDLEASGWVLLRAWNEGANPLILDLYPYATTSPIYIDVAGQSPKSGADAQYFVQWMDRVIDAAEARDDYNDNEEKEETLKYLGAAREVFRGKL
ncbi:Tol biopolymer transport system component [Povalibacter uvarum]|uniref:Tol biopolymer transport system component n=1 Tax=Povalibacter uvarum TaxID=732238 RepID=A0A841HI33_9GAMM|nr:CehA/McbA family metallohydrolase [Povalibacter uvarum]MBB6092456.1 Tol biopolymer transport system component [Povalibacter uvarum]